MVSPSKYGEYSFLYIYVCECSCIHKRFKLMMALLPFMPLKILQLFYAQLLKCQPDNQHKIGCPILQNEPKSTSKFPQIENPHGVWLFGDPILFTKKIWVVGFGHVESTSWVPALCCKFMSIKLMMMFAHYNIPLLSKIRYKVRMRLGNE